MAAEDLPRYPAPFRAKRDPRDEEWLKRLKRWREVKALQLGIDAGIVANNSLLEILAETAPGGLEAIPAMKRWQRQEFGAELVELLRQGR